MELEDLKLIINAIESGKCLAFLGAGACTPFKDHKNKVITGLPTGGELAKKLAEKCQYNNGKDYDLMKVAEYFLYYSSGDRGELERAIKEQIEIGCTPRPIHTVLAQLKQLKFIITTNYDNLLEEELSRYKRLLFRHVHDQRGSQTGKCDFSYILKPEEIILHKMHGTVEDPGSMVITESDYIQYLAIYSDHDKGMPDYFRNLIPRSKLLFLGYSLGDWNFRVIWEGVLSIYANRNIRKDAYALVKKPERFQKRYWSRRNVDFFDQDLTEFAVQLAKHFNLAIPSMGIKKRPEKRKK